MLILILRENVIVENIHLTRIFLLKFSDVYSQMYNFSSFNFISPIPLPGFVNVSLKSEMAVVQVVGAMIL